MVGYADLFRNRFEMNRRLTWVFTFSAITLVLYLAALFNALLPAVYGICGLGAILSVYQLVRYVTKKDTFRVPDFIALGMLLYLLAFGSVLFKSPLLHYDNFTYWATIVKFLYSNDSLPTQQDAIISYYTYPVGSSMFIYFVTKIVGFSEGTMLVGQLLLTLSGLYALFGSLRDERRALPSALIFGSFALFNTFNIAIRLNNLLVDFLLPVLALAAISACYAYRNHFWRLSVHMVVVLGTLSIVKVSGLFFVAIALILYVSCVVRLFRRRRVRWWAIFPSLATIGLNFSPYLLWQRHIALHFTNASEAKHAVSFSELGHIMTGKIGGVAREIIDAFTSQSLDLSQLATRGIIALNVVMLVVVLAFVLLRKHSRRFITAWLLVDVMIVAYYIGILLMYLTAMPTDEALELAGFERYTSSMVIMAYGLLAMVLAREIDHALFEKTFKKRDSRSFKNLGTKRLYQYTSLGLLIVSTALLLSEKNSITYTNKKHQTPSLTALQQITGNRMTPSEQKVLLVTADKEIVDSYFITYAARYYLWNVHVDARENFLLDDQEFTQILASYDEVLLLDNHHTFNAMTKKVFGKTYEPGLYQTATMLAAQSKE
ncbi:hypothetical protein [Streptococcus alactolyticus]|uniref:hypothetical protein n=1 Tax=Streptococcus alactolyticus TaxID=29389 RepID=UPI003CFBEDC0